MSALQNDEKNGEAERKRHLAAKESLSQNASSKQAKLAKVIIRSTKDNQSRLFVITEKPSETAEIAVPEQNANKAAIPSQSGREKPKHQPKRRQKYAVPAIDEEGLRVTPSLERGLKILAAAVPNGQRINHKINISNKRNIYLKNKNGLTIRPIITQTEPQTQTTGIPQNTTPLMQTVNEVQMQQGVQNITESLLQVNPLPVIPASINNIPNYVNTNGNIILASAPSIPVPEQNRNIIYTSTAPNVLYNISGTTTPSVIVKPEVDTLPKISAVHSQYSLQALPENKINKCEQICNDIEDNPSLYLGVGKKELCVLKLISNVCQLTRKQVFVIIRKMRHNESVDILADLFEMSMEEVVQVIIDNVPKIAHLIRKTLKIASRTESKQCIIDQIPISVHKASYLSEQPEEVSRYSTKVDLKYLISCTHSGLINFISKGYEYRSKYSNIGQLYRFINSVKPNNVCIVGSELRDIDWKYLKFKNVNVKKSRDICYRMNFIRALDGIKQFKIFCNSEIPLRYEFFNIIDDILVLACWLYNCKVM